MRERQRRSLLDRIFEMLLEETLGRVRSYVERKLGLVVQRAILGLLGVGLIAAGLVLIAMGVIKYLSLLMPGWLAWGLVGLITALLGIVLVMATVAKTQR